MCDICVSATTSVDWSSCLMCLLCVLISANAPHPHVFCTLRCPGFSLIIISLEGFFLVHPECVRSINKTRSVQFAIVLIFSVVCCCVLCCMVLVFGNIEKWNIFPHFCVRFERFKTCFWLVVVVWIKYNGICILYMYMTSHAVTSTSLSMSRCMLLSVQWYGWQV